MADLFQTCPRIHPGTVPDITQDLSRTPVPRLFLAEKFCPGLCPGQFLGQLRAEVGAPVCFPMNTLPVRIFYYEPPQASQISVCWGVRHSQHHNKDEVSEV